MWLHCHVCLLVIDTKILDYYDATLFPTSSTFTLIDYISMLFLLLILYMPILFDYIFYLPVSDTRKPICDSQIINKMFASE